MTIRFLGIGLLGAACLVACQSPVTWSHQVAPVLETYCTRCHNESGAAPFALQSYAEVSTRKARVKRELDRGTMPPWLPGDGCRPLQSAETNRPTAAELAIIDAWLADEAPEGKSGVMADIVAPPDLEGELQTFNVTFNPIGHAIHAVTFAQCYKVVLPNDVERQLVAFEVQTTHPKSLVAVGLHRLTAEQAAAIGDDFQCEGHPGAPGLLSRTPFADSGFLGIWQQGNGPVRFPPGTGVTLAANEVVLVRMRYHPTATDGLEVTQVSLKFASSPVQEARVISIANSDFLIPPYAEKVQDSATFTAPGPGRIYGVAPHLRARGRTLKLDTEGTCALNLTSWSDQWQLMYWFSEGPLSISAGSKLNLSCTWNNAASSSLVSPGEGPTSELCAASLYWVDGLL